jgi:GH18 family chitinase
MASLGSDGLFDGDFLTYEQLKNNLLVDANYVSNWDNPTQTPYVYNSQAQVQIAYDDTRSIQSKLDYASKHVNTH